MRSRREALELAKARLDTLDYYPEPVRLRGVRVRVSPLIFKLFANPKFSGMATRTTIWLKAESLIEDENLITHELCHVWQSQQRYFHMHLTYLRVPYDENPYEAQAREAVRATSTPRGHLRLVSG